MHQFEKDVVSFTLKLDSFWKAHYDSRALQIYTLSWLILGRK